MKTSKKLFYVACMALLLASCEKTYNDKLFWPGEISQEYKTQCTERAFLEADIDELDSLFASNTNIGGICVLNSRGHVIADYLQQKRIKGISIVAFDLTEKNIQSLKDGSIFALICQKPEKQGFMAVTTLLEYLLYRKTKQESHYLMPLDIVLRENLPYYQ